MEKQEMFTLITKEHEGSNEVVRKTNYAHAFAMATRGGFFSAQIVNELGVVELETRQDA